MLRRSEDQGVPERNAVKAVQIDGRENVGDFWKYDVELGDQFDFRRAMRGSRCSLRATVTKYSWSTCKDTTPVLARRCSAMDRMQVDLAGDLRRTSAREATALYPAVCPPHPAPRVRMTASASSRTESTKFDTRSGLFQRLAKQEVRNSSTSPGSKKYVLETLEVGADLSGH